MSPVDVTEARAALWQLALLLGRPGLAEWQLEDGTPIDAHACVRVLACLLDEVAP